MSQEATKSEYAIALIGLFYIGAFTAAEQAAELGTFAYRRLRRALGEPAESNPRTIRAAAKQSPRRG
jgi:hypothetical protein